MSANAAALLAEVEALRRRLAALEERLPRNPAEQLPGHRARRRTSTKTVVRLTTGAMPATLAGGVISYAADSLIIGPDGATIVAKSINFGNRFGALLTLWNPDYVTGIQPSTIYQRSGKNFAWYKGGQHTDTELDPGGGSKMMSLTDGNLDVAGTATMTGLNLTGTATMTGLNLTGTATMTGLEVTGDTFIKQIYTDKTKPDEGVKIQGASGRNMFTDNEKAGLLRVGAAFGIPGIYSEKGDVVVGSQSGNIQLRGNVTATGVVDGNMKVVYQKG